MATCPVPEDFFKKLSDKYEVAEKEQHVVFGGSSATFETVEDHNRKFHLTLLQSLNQRPQKGDKNDNPFAKPEPELTILDKFGPSDEFRVVFNKFPLVPRHFMIVTRDFKSQNTPLSPSELSATYSLLVALKKQQDRDWFAFYNCGPESGASQPHKHIQFMTLPTDYTPLPDRIALNSHPFIPDTKQEPLQDGDLPFAHFIARLPDNFEDVEEDDLVMYFSSLLQRALTVLRSHEQSHISYNFCLTTKYMLLVPRSSGVFKDTLGINSCGMMGLILTKDDNDVKIIKEVGPATVLAEVGFPSTAGEGTDEYHY